MTEIWDEVWSHKKVKTDYSLRLYSYLDSIAKKLPAESSVIEVGCGSGEGMAQFDKLGLKTIGIDISFEALKYAKKTSNATLLGADGFHIPFEDETFSFSYNSGVIEHFEYPKDLALLMEMARITKSGGFVLVIVPNRSCFWYRLLKSGARRVKKWEFGFERNYAYSELEDLFFEANLEVVDKVGLMVFPPLANHSREFLPEKTRRKMMRIDSMFPNRHLYAYAVGILGRKK